MARYGFLRGWNCPRCDGETEIFYEPGPDPATRRCGWRCPREDCQAIGFGFESRRRARVALREYRERFAHERREYR
ncbi:hypothetical protein G9C85_06025 [Halorubellus sp. JP-L1]|uniref:hypothetical protein n=1 Tax=Halorubellus sp. JP-L1 TaxID=2715753 RepID=UPI00140A186B|nr:hypothetical protein [Halorubellus sp. JP-L1]NHN41194.1 hypothetical protein [Halorubellus sp. JP-L1]